MTFLLTTHRTPPIYPLRGYGYGTVGERLRDDRTPAGRSDACGTAFSYRERRFAQPIHVFFSFFFWPEGPKKKSMKHNWRMVDKRGVRSSRRRFNHPAGVSIIPQAFRSSRRRLLPFLAATFSDPPLPFAVTRPSNVVAASTASPHR